MKKLVTILIPVVCAVAGGVLMASMSSGKTEDLMEILKDPRLEEMARKMSERKNKKLDELLEKLMTFKRRYLDHMESYRKFLTMNKKMHESYQEEIRKIARMGTGSKMSKEKRKNIAKIGEESLKYRNVAEKMREEQRPLFNDIVLELGPTLASLERDMIVAILISTPSMFSELVNRPTKEALKTEIKKSIDTVRDCIGPFKTFFRKLVELNEEYKRVSEEHKGLVIAVYDVYGVYGKKHPDKKKVKLLDDAQDKLVSNRKSREKLVAEFIPLLLKNILRYREIPQKEEILKAIVEPFLSQKLDHLIIEDPSIIGWEDRDLLFSRMLELVNLKLKEVQEKS